MSGTTGVNVGNHLAKLQGLAGKMPSRVSKRIGFNASYAAAVHENLTAKHSVGQAKFLEVAMNMMKPKMTPDIESRLAQGATLLQAVDEFGEAVIALAQKLCPVATGFLQGSATTEPAVAG